MSPTQMATLAVVVTLVVGVGLLASWVARRMSLWMSRRSRAEDVFDEAPASELPVEGPTAIPPWRLGADRILFRRTAPNTDIVPRQESEHEPESAVDFNVFVPNRVVPGSHFMVDVWVHRTADYGRAVQRARELARELNVGGKSGVPLKRGIRLSILLRCQRMEVDGPLDDVFWDGEPVNASFAVHAPQRVTPGSHAGSAEVRVEGMTIATVRFVLQVASEADTTISNGSSRVEQPRTAFVSYARADQSSVLQHVRGMKQARPDFEIDVDVLKLRAGEQWQRELERLIPTRDIFYLFWSAAAARSERVEAEWRLALDRRGLDYICPVPLVDPAVVPPPRELSRLHFFDPLLVQAALASQRSARKRGMPLRSA